MYEKERIENRNCFYLYGNGRYAPVSDYSEYWNVPLCSACYGADTPLHQLRWLIHYYAVRLYGNCIQCKGKNPAQLAAKPINTRQKDRFPNGKRSFFIDSV